jgi:hypothetical protein
VAPEMGPLFRVRSISICSIREKRSSPSNAKGCFDLRFPSELR